MARVVTSGRIATAEPPDASAGYAPECAWCPVCRAIRMARDSNPDLAGRVGETAGALMSAAHDVVSAIDASLSRMPGPRPLSPRRPSDPRHPNRPGRRNDPRHRTSFATGTSFAAGTPRPPQPGTPPSRNGQQGRQVRLTIGIDVGGTKVAAGVVDERGKIVEKLRRPTPSSDPVQTVATISEVVTELLGRHTVDAVGLGIAGFVDEDRATSCSPRTLAGVTSR